MISGIEFAGTASGIKPSGLDLGLVFFRGGMNVFTLYTRNKVKAAHILYDKTVETGPVRALLVNSGCANACTGKEGVNDLGVIAGKLAPILKIRPAGLLFASTGVIGKRLPADTIIRSLPLLVKNLKDTHVDAFSRAIMTTDTYPKVVKETFRGKKEYSVMGVAKGSGMINPLFATMLAFVFTDYPVPQGALKKEFVHSVKESFERITVDGECSTNDTVMLFTRRGPEDRQGIAGFKEALLSVMQNLAMMIVKDGEGATRVAHIIVNGAKKKEIAEKIARRIAVSPLTKTAFFGCDPNWGRIIAAAGDAGVSVQQSKIDIILQGEQVAKNGVEVPFDEETMKKMMSKKDISVIVNLNDGKASFDIYTTDLTYDYVKINASYRS
ncbi:MAG: Arginine biosynthesis bifunctional protein ArgJ [Syntrophorhabdus sp. PtaU1.Bin058]|nr:MAG: Arginine biosynthesis bifunctional protein ArgJ [Syntrophorhabdus sp. PtaU1.Bin058]